MNKEGELTNFMVVAFRQEWKSVLNTNYGATTLDLYAPGTDIYSSIWVIRTKKVQGRNGFGYCSRCSCLVKPYFPKLTGSQIRDILLKSVTSRKGVEVRKRNPRKRQSFTRLVPFR